MGDSYFLHYWRTAKSRAVLVVTCGIRIVRVRWNPYAYAVASSIMNWDGIALLKVILYSRNGSETLSIVKTGRIMESFNVQLYGAQFDQFHTVPQRYSVVS